MFYHKTFCKVYNIAKGYSDFFFFFNLVLPSPMLPFECPQNSNTSPKMETSPQIPTHASQTCTPLSFGALPPISALQCEFSEQTTSCSAGEGKQISS